MGKKLRCSVVESDWIGRCEECCGDVAIMVCIDNKKEHILLTPSDARKLRKQIKKALEAIEGTEQESEA